MWRALDARPAAELYEQVLARYAEPQRHYHTPHHLDECFAQLDGARELAERPAEVELALWFHDAIYDPKRHDNEALSAIWARTSALSSGIERDAADRIEVLILCTRHEAAPQDRDAKLLVDIDLSILGASAARFAEYEAQVRREYIWVPAFLYRRKRREILEGFLARPTLFSTAPFRERLEAPARANLARSIASL